MVVVQSMGPGVGEKEVGKGLLVTPLYAPGPQLDSIRTVQDAIMKLLSCVVPIKMIVEFRDGHGPSICSIV